METPDNRGSNGKLLIGIACNELWQPSHCIAIGGPQNLFPVILLMRPNMQHWHFHSTAQCPCCPCPHEDKKMPLCPSESAKRIWNKAMADLAKWLCNQGSDPLLSTDLVSLLNAWCNSAETADLQP